MEQWTDKIISCEIEKLHTINFPLNERFGLKKKKKNVQYKFIIDIKTDSEILLILGPGAIPEKYKEKYINRPVFSRVTWKFDQSTIYYDDPTRFIEGVDLLGGWGIGTSDNWYTEELAKIIEIIANNIYNYNSENHFKNLVFYGSSMAGFMSLQLSTLVRNSTSICEIPQLDLMKWSYWPTLKKNLFNNLTDDEIISNFSFKLNIFDLIDSRKYIPNAYLILDCSNKFDFNMQYTDFFLELNKLPFLENKNKNNIRIRIDGKNEGHKQLSYEDCYELINNVCSTLSQVLSNKITIKNNYFDKYENKLGDTIKFYDDKKYWTKSSTGILVETNQYTNFKKNNGVELTYISLNNKKVRSIGFDLYFNGLRTSSIISLRNNKSPICEISLKLLNLDICRWNHIILIFNDNYCIIKNNTNNTLIKLKISEFDRFYFRLGTEDIELKWKNFKIKY